MGRERAAAGYQPLEDGEPNKLAHAGSSASLGPQEGSAKGGTAFQAGIPPPDLDVVPVDSSLRFNPSSAVLSTSTRRWLHIDDRGQARLVEVDKHHMCRELHIRYRDLLALDPSVPLPCPATLLIRERAIVVNLESVRMIACANQVYLLSVPKEGDPRVAAAPHPDNPFVRSLCRVLAGGASASASRASLQQLAGPSPIDPFNELPYELRALECALELAVGLLSAEVAGLEAVAYPAIEALAVAVSRQALEAVRGVKGDLNRLLGRVQRIKQEIAEIMDDDSDMQDMYLGRRAALAGQPLPPQPPATPLASARPHRTYGNLLGALQQEPPATLALPPTSASQQALQHAALLLRPASAGSELGAAAGGPAVAAVVPERSANEPAEAGAAAARAEQHTAASPAAEEWGRGLTRTASHDAHHKEGGRGGSGGRAAHELWGRGGALARHAGRVVRTVRRLRKSKGPKRRGGSRQAGAAGEGQPGDEEYEDEDGSEGSVIEEEEEVVEQLPPGVVDPHDVQEAEDLLEAYFMQVDYLLRRLVLLSERTAATEALLSIEMDHRRNELVALDLLVTCVTGAFAFVSMVAGILGMNLPFGAWAQSQAAFMFVLWLMFAGGAMLLALILLHIRRRRLMFISSVAP